MKCPRCGAEIDSHSKFCGSCGSQISFQMQREQEYMNRAGCPRCQSSNIQFRRENQGEVRGKHSKYVIHRTVGFCKDCGYTWIASTDSPTIKKNNTIWWILGWIFFFPAPVMVLIWRDRNKWNTITKIAVTAAFWIVFLLIGLVNNSGDSRVKVTPSVSNQVISTSSNTELLIGPSVKNNEPVSEPSNIIDDFVSKFNTSSTSPLVFVEGFTPSDNKNSHYRVEFRLNAYKNAEGKSYSYNGDTVDLVSRKDIFGESHLRVYMSGASFENCLEMVRIASPIMDEAIAYNELTNTLNYLKDKRSANGYYYSNLGLGLLGNINKGYDLMMKGRND